MTEFQPWDADKARQLRLTAQNVAFNHGPHSDKIARDNCGACAVRSYTRADAPNYAGWLRIWIEIGWQVPRQHYETELEYAQRENPAYYEAIMRDIATWGIRFEDDRLSRSRRQAKP